MQPKAAPWHQQGWSTFGRRSAPKPVNYSTPIYSAAVARLVEDLRSRGGLKGTDLANITEVSQATVSRWATGQASPHAKTQLVISDLKYVVDCLAEFYSPEETRIWLYARHPLMAGKRAIDLIHDGETERVLTVIESLAEGTYT